MSAKIWPGASDAAASRATSVDEVAVTAETIIRAPAMAARCDSAHRNVALGRGREHRPAPGRIADEDVIGRDVEVPGRGKPGRENAARFAETDDGEASIVDAHVWVHDAVSNEGQAGELSGQVTAGRNPAAHR